jgi:2-oxoglutarate ferredoxin oxidoreductase subunit alpha
MTPCFLPIGDEVLVRQTSSTHGPDGYITTDFDQIGKNQERLKKKLVSTVDRFTLYEEIIADDADTLVITYGVTARAAKEAFMEQKREGKAVSLLVLKTIWPVPENLIREKAKEVKRVLMIEMNLGQYVREIQRILPDKKVHFFGQMNGKLITPHQIREAIANV